jgi:uncharacterized membrane protein
MHAILVFATLPLFVGALLSDWAYAVSYQVQWVNFASWLIAGAMVLAGLALLWALIAHFRAGAAARPRRSGAYLLALLAAVVLGFVNALVHAKDAFASMPAGLVLSALVVVPVLLASALGLPAWRQRIST